MVTAQRRALRRPSVRLLLLSAATLALLAPAARAGSVTLTPASDTISLTEGMPGTFHFTVTNGGSSAVTFAPPDGVGLAGFTFVSGDPDQVDQALMPRLANNGLAGGATLAPGGTATFDVNFKTQDTSGVVEAVPDSGTWKLKVVAAYSANGQTQFAQATVFAIVNDGVAPGAPLDKMNHTMTFTESASSDSTTFDTPFSLGFPVQAGQVDVSDATDAMSDSVRFVTDPFAPPNESRFARLRSDLLDPPDPANTDGPVTIMNPDGSTFTFTIVSPAEVVPEPSSLTLLGIALGMFGYGLRRRRAP